MPKNDEGDRLAQGLGASRVVDLGVTVGGPLDLLRLQEEVHGRLRSSGGRPTDPAWTTARQVPFKPENWQKLQDLAAAVGESGRRVAAAHLAAFLIERGLDEVEEQRWHFILEASRGAPLKAGSEAADSAGVTFRQLEAWRKEGVIKPASIEGGQRLFSIDAVVRMAWLRSLVLKAESRDEVKARVAVADLSGRYLLFSGELDVRSARGGDDLLSSVASGGSYVVIDQLPLRSRILGIAEEPVEVVEESEAADGSRRIQAV